MKIQRLKDSTYAQILDQYTFPGEDLDEGESEDWVWWGAYDGVHMVAYAAAKPYPDLRCVYLCRAGVLPVARGNGLQKRLIRARVAYGKALDYDYAISYTMPGNVVSSNNLIASGFSLYNPETAWAGDYALYWCKRL